jgi:hypothetical protein
MRFLSARLPLTFLQPIALSFTQVEGGDFIDLGGALSTLSGEQSTSPGLQAHHFHKYLFYKQLFYQ